MFQKVKEVIYKPESLKKIPLIPIDLNYYFESLLVSFLVAVYFSLTVHIIALDSLIAL